jgi:hypothetical protein
MLFRYALRSALHLTWHLFVCLLQRLYVRWEVTDDSLKAAFERFGKISETRVVRGPRLRAFGFLTFETEGMHSAAHSPRMREKKKRTAAVSDRARLSANATV